ncbi:unnamed protein product [marine sediment metagenome]|uniref:Uncharacterized protein n=1 Tax=marine sediment metagenome TaxID=412755 RepID=X0VJD0_9ZZZZ
MPDHSFLHVGGAIMVECGHYMKVVKITGFGAPVLLNDKLLEVGDIIRSTDHLQVVFGGEKET